MGCLCTEPAKELGLGLRFESEKVVWERIKKIIRKIKNKEKVKK